MSFKVANTESFRFLRTNGGYYVDKTWFLEAFLKAPADAILFTRPRRFGKTLFISMLAEFFDMKKQSQDLFSGLKVASNEELCKMWMNKFPVISISLKKVNGETFNQALEIIRDLLASVCTMHIEVLDNNSLATYDRMCFKELYDGLSSELRLRDGLGLLTKILAKHYGIPCVLLIDEYDTPISKAKEWGYYDKMEIFLREFISNGIKTNDYKQFAFLTGFLPFAKESAKSGLNNPSCFGMDTSVYANLFGFTQSEVDTMLVSAGLENKKDIIKEWYDGYRFGNRQEIYCPWSIMRYLEHVCAEPDEEPDGYWARTSGNELLKDFKDKLPPIIQEHIAALYEGKSIPVELNISLTYNEINQNYDNFWTLLYLEGYLTTTTDPSNCIMSPRGMTILKIPNNEIRQVFKLQIKPWVESLISKYNQEEFFSLFWDGDAQGVEQLLSEKLKLSTAIQEYKYKEYFYQIMLHGIFLFEYPVLANRESGEGVFDLMLEDGRGNAAIIEIKRADKREELEGKVEEAMQQIVDRSYDAPLKARKDITKIFHWGMAFYKKSCKMGVKAIENRA